MKLLFQLDQYLSTTWSQEYSQTESDDCGFCCIGYLARRLLKSKVTLEHLKSISSDQKTPLSLFGLKEVSKKMGIILSPYKVEDKVNLDSISLPAILHLKNNHYIVVYRKVTNHVYDVFDPAKGSCLQDKLKLEENCSNYFLEIAQTVSDRITSSPKVEPQQFYKKFDSHKRKLVWVLLLAVLSQLIAVGPPVVTQIAIDSLVEKDSNTVYLALIFCTLLLCTEMILTYLRGALVNQLKADLSFDSAKTLFSNLWKIPLASTVSKTSGRVLNDFESIHTARDIYCNDLVSFWLNVSILFISFLFLAYYSLSASLVILIGAAFYVIIKIMFIPKYISIESDHHASKSKFDSLLYETFEQIDNIRRSPQRNNINSKLKETYSNRANDELRFNNFSLSFSIISIAVFGFVTLITMTICLTSVLTKDISIGYAFGFLALQQRFILAASQTIDSINAISLLNVCKNRISFFINNLDNEENNSWKESVESEKFSINAENYASPSGKFSPLTFKVISGDFVTITGDSGSGKSMMLKRLVAATTQPDPNFNFIYNSKYFFEFFPQISIVNQNEKLFSGTVLDNITCFANDIDQDSLRCCIDTCELNNVFSNLKYGLLTSISSNAAPISGGQLQRLLIARALYTKPNILILDEATSDLDIKNEIDLLKKIQKIVDTLIIVTHKSEIFDLGTQRIILSTKE